MAEIRRASSKVTGSQGGPAAAVSIPVLLVTLVTALAAAATVMALPATVGWGAALVTAVAGGVFAMRLAPPKTESGDDRARLLLEIADAPVDRDPPPLPRLPGAWGALYQKVGALVQEARTGRSAIAELERFRRQTELATAAYRGAKDPLVESEEVRGGPLHDQLEAAQKRPAPEADVVSRIPLGEEELVGVDGEPFPVPWPAPAEEGVVADPRARADLLRGLDELIEGLSRLHASFEAGPDAVGGAAPGVRTPAQLVDAVVHTAADGIEDLAAGLMRANELAGVAERVTNRATLLALNAALEATRSGSEAFAAIAEETRRLAEFAREATDTIARLANEIEYKVGETIHAIHETSDDAKRSLAALGGAPPVSAPPVRSRSEVKALLARARDLRRSLGAPAPEETGPASPRRKVESAPAPAGATAPAPGGPPEASVQSSPPGEPVEDASASASAAAGAYLTIDASVREDLVENDRPSSETSNTKDFLLLEGLEPGSRMAG